MTQAEQRLGFHTHDAGARVATRLDETGSPNFGRMDRLGSVKAWQRYPFGEGNESNWNDEYATYPIDRSTGHYYAWNRFYSATWGRFSSPAPYVMSGGLATTHGWNCHSCVGNDPVNRYDPPGLAWSYPCYQEGVHTTCCSFGDNIVDSFLYNVLMLSDGPPSTGYDIVGRLFDIAAPALYNYARGFARRLREGPPSDECISDIVTLGISPDDWAEKLDPVSIVNGIGSSDLLYPAPPSGSEEQNLAKERKLTIGHVFGGSSNSATVALSSANDTRVWIDPMRINPFDWVSGSALIAHEALHKFGLTDRDIQELLSLDVNAPSINISKKLASDCFPGSSAILLP